MITKPEIKDLSETPDWASPRDADDFEKNKHALALGLADIAFRDGAMSDAAADALGQIVAAVLSIPAIEKRLEELEKRPNKRGRGVPDGSGFTTAQYQEIVDGAAPVLKEYIAQEVAAGLTQRDIDALTSGMAPVIREYVAKALDPIGKRLDKLEARATMTFRGIWDDAETYQRGHVVTDGGSLWVCLDEAKRQRPGRSADWKLIAKAGSAPA